MNGKFRLKKVGTVDFCNRRTNHLVALILSGFPHHLNHDSVILSRYKDQEHFSVLVQETIEILLGTYLSD